MNIPETSSVESPIVLFGFNRPSMMERQVRIVANAHPRKVYFITDGARSSRPEEVAKVAETRSLANLFDKSTIVVRIESETNLGCRARIQTGLDLVFDEEEMAIILEDDCHPAKTFLPFADQLLHKYAGDSRIGAISGTNFGYENSGTDSYFYSMYPFVWGWATWRRVWRLYDKSAQSWSDENVKKFVRSRLHSVNEDRFWTHAFNSIQQGFDTWDFQLALTFLRNDLASVVPSDNQITNVGFGVEATHTTAVGPLANLATRELSGDLVSPEHFGLNAHFDNFVAESQYRRTVLTSIRQRARSYRSFSMASR
jgi:hypothetical protein